MPVPIIKMTVRTKRVVEINHKCPVPILFTTPDVLPSQKSLAEIHKTGMDTTANWAMLRILTQAR